MNYLTNYYKNRCEQLQEQINKLNSLLEDVGIGPGGYLDQTENPNNPSLANQILVDREGASNLAVKYRENDGSPDLKLQLGAAVSTPGSFIKTEKDPYTGKKTTRFKTPEEIANDWNLLGASEGWYETGPHNTISNEDKEEAKKAIKAIQFIQSQKGSPEDRRKVQQKAQLEFNQDQLIAKQNEEKYGKYGIGKTDLGLYNPQTKTIPKK